MDLNLTVQFDESAYELQFKGGLLTFRGSGGLFMIKSQPCNQALVDRVVGVYQRLLAASAAERAARTPTAYDVRIFNRNKLDEKPLQVSRGSRFGTWLRRLPTEIFYLNSEARIACKR